MWSKYWTGTVPLLVLALLITGVTNVLLQASPFMMAVSIGTDTALHAGDERAGALFGTLFPQFDTENAAQIPTSFGGLVYMMASVCLLGVVIALEARPVLQFVRANQAGVPLELDLPMAVMFGASAVLCLASTLIALRIGLRRIREIDA